MVSIRTTSKQIRKKLTPQENRLKVKLHKFYKQNIRGRQEPTEVLRRVYENQIKIIIRQAIEEAYFTGFQVVENTVGKRRQYFISVTDIQNIKDLSNKMNEQFWVTTTKLHMRENEFIISLATQEMIKKQEFDTEAAYIGIASLMVYAAYNNSVKSKLVQVIQQ